MPKQTGCYVKQTSATYLNRPSPPYSASKCPEGHKEVGNDNKLWFIVKNKNGVGRWTTFRKRNKSEVLHESKPKAKNKWQVTIKLFFVRTNDESNEPNPTQKELDGYMRRGTGRYKMYLYNIYGEFEYKFMPKKIKYHDGGKLSYELDATDPKGNLRFPTAKSVKEHILDNSFEDGLFEGNPGELAVYPTRNQYIHSYTYEGINYTSKYYDELGVIDCRKRSSIVVKKV